MSRNKAVREIADMVSSRMDQPEDYLSAVQEVTDLLVNDWRIAKRLLADGLAYFAVSSAASDVRRLEGLLLFDDLDLSDTVDSPITTELPANWGTNRRANRDPTKYVVSVGNSGLYKRIGDLTAEDLLVHAGFLRKASDTLRKKATRFEEIAGRIDATVADAWNDVLTVDDRNFLREWANL